jgi:hypothetical protein
MNYKSGFAGQWWYLLTPAAGILVALTGWGISRFRETRAMTLGQLVGMRYGENARIFFGAVVFLAGVVNMGIFPAVGAGFFIYFCGLPERFAIAGFESVAVAICFWGGQITVVGIRGVSPGARAIFDHRRPGCTLEARASGKLALEFLGNDPKEP